MYTSRGATKKFSGISSSSVSPLGPFGAGVAPHTIAIQDESGSIGGSGSVSSVSASECGWSSVIGSSQEESVSVSEEL